MSSLEGRPVHYEICGLQADDIISVIIERWAHRWYEEGKGYDEVAIASAYLFNILKYALRAPSKNGIEDMIKMGDYNNSFIEVME